MSKKFFDQYLSSKDIKINEEIILHKGFCTLISYKLNQRYFNGAWSHIYTRECISREDVVASILYDPILKKIILIEQFRIGALSRHLNTPWLIEVVAGIKNSFENTKIAVKREIYEETGLKVKKLFLINEYFSTPGYSTEKITLFCSIVDSNKIKKFGGLKQENEDIKVHSVSIHDAFAMLRNGIINNATTIISLMWLELNLSSIENIYCY